MKDTVYDKVKNYIMKYHMIEAGDLIAVGVSGGADSVCLLHLMHRLSGEIAYRLIAVHVNHGVRVEAAEDAAYAQRLCEEWKIPFFLRNVDMNGYAAEYKLSSEEAGRQLRYQAFEEVLRQQRKKEEHCKIAVAHNAEDRAETMLFHLFRGSGIRGLSSIQPIRENVIRPILCLERSEIEAYLAGRRLKYCQDSTNETDAYTRNKIRHHILAYAKQEICSGAVTHMGELADILSETEGYLNKQAWRLYGMYVEEVATGEADCEGYCSAPESPESEVYGQQPVCLRIEGAKLLMQDPVMYRKVLLLCMERLTPHRKDITGQHIADLVKLIAKSGSKELSLPHGMKAYKEYDLLILCKNAGESIEAQTGMCGDAMGKVYTVEPPMEIYVPGEGTYTFTLLANNDKFCEKQQNIPQNRYTKWFDYDKITTTALLRTRQPGDYLTIDGALHTKSVKQYMINEKIPKLQRDNMHILVDGAHVLWIPGYRISERYKVEESTKRILQVRLRGGRHGGTN